jgi:hypothetical protein
VCVALHMGVKTAERRHHTTCTWTKVTKHSPTRDTNEVFLKRRISGSAFVVGMCNGHVCPKERTNSQRALSCFASAQILNQTAGNALIRAVFRIWIPASLNAEALSAHRYNSCR